jgi:hypothetical protein
MGVSGLDHASEHASVPTMGGLPGRARSVRSCIVLCGAVRRTPLARSIGRSIVDLPLSDGSTIMGRHLDSLQNFARRWRLDGFRVRILVDSDSFPPRQPEDREGLTCVVERDASPIRGVAGVLADATRDCDPDSFVVVVNGAQVFRQPLDELIGAMLRKESDVSMVGCSDGTPVGLWLVRCGVLKMVRPVGYVDLKEQALPEWLARWGVSVVEHRRAYAVRTRNITEYLGAVRLHATRGLDSASVDEDPYREEWERSFAVIEPGADVASSATIHDSVVLAGAVVGKDAVVVRSVVCPGAVVGAGMRCVGQVVGPGGRN